MILREKLQTTFIEKWDTKTANMSKSSFYKQYKSLGGFHLARQNLMELTGLRLDVHSDDQAMTGNQGYFDG